MAIQLQASTTEMVRWAVVDSADPRIEYTSSSNSWSTSSIPKSETDAFQGTITTLISSAGSLSFAFNGTKVGIYAPFSALNTTADPSTLPEWQCYVDGVEIASNQAYGSFPWQSYCETDDLNDGRHLLSANITIPNTANDIINGFIVDFIRYVPSDDVSPGIYQWKMIEASDSKLGFTQSWQELGSAKSVGSQDNIVLTFTGTSLAWYSLSTASILRFNDSFQTTPGNSSDTVTVFIDMSPDGSTFAQNASFQSRQSISSIDNQYNSLLFETPTLSNATHNISFNYRNENGLFPLLTLDYLILIETAPPPTTSTPDSDSSGASSVPIAPVLGAILAVFVLLCLGALVMRHRLRTHYEQTNPESNSRRCVQPFADPAEKSGHSSSANLTLAAATSHTNLLSGHLVIDPFLDAAEDKASAHLPCGASSHGGGGSSARRSSQLGSPISLSSSQPHPGSFYRSSPLGSPISAHSAQWVHPLPPPDGVQDNDSLRDILDSSPHGVDFELREIVVRSRDSGYRSVSVCRPRNLVVLPPEYTVE